jgi:hypothetical protein
MIMGGTAFPGASTYEISIQPSEIGTRMGILGTANNQINLSLEADGSLKLARGSEVEGEAGGKPVKNFTATVTSQIRLQPGHWYRIAVVYDLKTIKLYVDDKLEGEAECPPKAYHAFINHLTVGSLCGWVFKPHTFFKGDIRQIRLYGRNLSQNEFLK